MGQLHRASIHVIAHASLGPVADDKHVADVGLCAAACLRTDRPDGLFPTVVVEADGLALGLVYSTAQSICAAVRSGRGVYWSRSRGGLWRKGDSSGAWQVVMTPFTSSHGCRMIVSIIHNMFNSHHFSG